MKPQLYHLHALSALHCGTGQSAGVVDLPIARARATNLPIVPGSSLRGVLREEFAAIEGEEAEKLEKILFGPRSISGNEDAHAGALAVGDANLLLLPIRALSGIVAYATCPFILKQYRSDLKLANRTFADMPTLADNQAMHCDGCANVQQNKVVLEDLDLNASQSKVATAWAKLIAESIFPGDQDAQTDLQQHFLILSDSVFAYLAETATEIRARIAIDQNTGTVKKGALWYEENLPAESVLWGVYAVTDSRVKNESRCAADLSESLPANLLLQLGGKAGVGRGLTRFINGDKR